jgi:hypothetical protein
MRAVLAVSICLSIPPFAMAGEGSSYVVCDNGLRCLKAPCPSSTAYDLAGGQPVRGVYADIDGLSEADRRRIRETDALYFGRLVLHGRIENRERTIAGRSHMLPSLIITGIGREATSSERRQCPSGDAG